MGNFYDTPYPERSDLEKTETQWRKSLGLLSRRDWSAALVRAVTAVEISLNLALRHEYSQKTQFSDDHVDRILRRANGVKGKIRLLSEVWERSRTERVKQLRAMIEEASEKRNRIVHSGEFCDERESQSLIANCRSFVVLLIGDYHDEFVLSDDAISPERDPGA